MNINIFKYVVRIKFYARKSWTHLKLHKTEHTRHFVWGKLSVYIEDSTYPAYPVCEMCNSSEIGEQGIGDEGLTVCNECGSIEQGYKYLSLKEIEGV